MEATSQALAFRHKTLVGLFLFQTCFQALLLTKLNTAGAIQVMGKRKDCDSCESDDSAQADNLVRKRRRYRSLDGIKVCQQASTIILPHDHALVIDRKSKQCRSA